MFIDLNGVRHHYVSKGEGPPILFVHGLGGSLHIWHGVIDNLSAHHHCVALDLAGHGRSDAAKGDVSIASMAADVHALIEALELPAVTLVGHSMSSLVAQHLALTRRETVDNLVLLGGISWFEPAVRKAYEERATAVEADGLDAIVDDWLTGALAPRTHGRSPQLVGLLRDLFLRNDQASYVKACRALASGQTIARDQIGQPTLILVGDHDRSTPMAMAEELHTDIPVSDVRVVPAASHWASLEEPDVISSAILEFLT